MVSSVLERPTEMSFTLGGFSTPFGVGRGRGASMSPTVLQFDSPVLGGNVARGNGGGAIITPLVSGSGALSLSHPTISATDVLQGPNSLII